MYKFNSLMVQVSQGNHIHTSAEIQDNKRLKVRYEATASIETDGVLLFTGKLPIPASRRYFWGSIWKHLLL